MSTLQSQPEPSNTDSNTLTTAAGTQPSTSSLEQLGYDEQVRASGEAFITDDFSIARVVQVNKSNYRISDGRQERIAEVSGKFLFTVETSLDYPTVGDWVVVQCFDDDSMAIIHNVLPRKSVLKRKDPGKTVEFQLIAANLDFALIMQSVDANFNLNRLERYLVMILDSKIQPIIVLSKTDLLSDQELSDIREQIHRFHDHYLILPVSNVTADGLDTLQQTLQPYKTYCLLGSSGVGKTTLLNTLIGEHRFDVNEVREKDHKGRHTTVSRQLIRLDSGSLFIDTPGMRELGNFAIDTGLEETFDDIVSRGRHCRYKDCTHTHEAGCAVKEAVEQGVIDPNRYDNYLRIQKEAAYYEMSYLDKRKRDKSRAKIIKNYKKMMRKK
jgi:ribosome biogenesis GTPase